LIEREPYRRATAGLLAAMESDGRFGRLLGAVDRPRLLLGD